MSVTSDVLIVGSGIAALAVAEQLCHCKNVIILTKKKIHTNNSILAQGGIAVALHEEDSFEGHLADTVIAGCDHNHLHHTEILVKEGKNVMKEWIEKGMVFDSDREGKLLMGMEGAHSFKRILHAGGDMTGRRLFETLYQRIKKKVTIIEDITVVDAIMKDGHCVGVVGKDYQGVVQHFFSEVTVLATGGIGGLYPFQSNATTATGDGVALGYRAGCRLKDLEFVQFHPTLLYVGGKGRGLVSEAVRGEGARLITASGRRIMKGVHPLEELAPRDIVARQIFLEQKAGEALFLDVSMIDCFQERFPTIAQLCKNNGVHPEKEYIPITPGAHFFMGGIETNEHGQTSVPNLYAVGEVACTGVHGANRLASNSLLECLVFGKRVGQHIQHQENVLSIQLRQEKENVYSLPSKEELRKKMMSHVGIIRSQPELLEMAQWLQSFVPLQWLRQPLACEKLTIDEIERVNMLTVAQLIVESALKRTESMGAHYRSDEEKRSKEQIVCTN